MERITADSVRSGSRLKEAKLLRALTVPPVMALMLITILYIGLGAEAFVTPTHYFAAVFALTLLPVLPYPLCAAIPTLKRKGRKLERGLAIGFSLIGYVLGLLLALLGGGTEIEKILFLTYTISGALTGIMTFVVRYKTSGHACGASAPFVLLAISLSPWWLLGCFALIPIFNASIQLGRHTLGQLFAGACVSVAALFIALRFVTLL
ncbi:MAG: hypothetical protein IJM20_03340 [Clostridia bacterium]|jgi:hypothetical protein|nr:hypothetical protein [Clostridia bacterium]